MGTAHELHIEDAYLLGVEFPLGKAIPRLGRWAVEGVRLQKIHEKEEGTLRIAETVANCTDEDIDVECPRETWSRQTSSK